MTISYTLLLFVFVAINLLVLGIYITHIEGTDKTQKSPRVINISTEEDKKGHPVFLPGKYGKFAKVDQEGNMKYESSSKKKRSIPDDSVKFFYYSKNHFQKVQIFESDLKGVKLESGPIKLITHGFLEYGSKDWILDMKKSYVDSDDNINIIVVDWEGLASTFFNYFAARENTRFVGAKLGDMVKSLRSLGYQNNIHCVGHGLGAHVCGYAGKNCNEGGNKINRITGLDPTGFLFDVNKPSDRLAFTDAPFVDVIHTCGRSGGLGLKEPMGHLDFFPNGGQYQNGCGIEMIGVCSHSRSYEYFTESISPNSTLIGTVCPSYEHFVNGSCNGFDRQPMGEHAKSIGNSTFTKYYLRTSDSPPYGKG